MGEEGDKGEEGEEDEDEDVLWWEVCDGPGVDVLRYSRREEGVPRHNVDGAFDRMAVVLCSPFE